MQRSVIILLLLSSYYQAAKGQNLVTNPGFEQYNNCPTGRSEINMSIGYDSFLTAIDWVDPTNTTPDYFNRCGTDSSVRLPYLSLDGFHEPHSGNACAGISMFTGNPNNYTTDYFNEYLETRLSSPMLAGHTYYVSYYVCLTYHGRTTYDIISVDRIGARLTNNMIDTTSQGPMFFMTGAQDIESPAGVFITDTANWTLVSGIYHAIGGEQWLTIGRFYPVPLSFIKLHTAEHPPYAGHSTCYMLIDDVCAIDMENPTGTDTNIYSPQFPIVIGDSKPGQYLWYNGDTSIQSEVSSPGTYLRQRWNDCSYFMDTFRVAEMPVENCLWMPSAFTPNNDGLNDFFGPGNNYCQPDFQSFNFLIFNRWGQKVFQTNDPGEKWDGTYNGKLAETGTYYYILQYTYGGMFSYQNNIAATAPKVIKGDVTLIR